jgi:hypothetical protein
LGRFISFEAPLVTGGSVLPVPKYAFAGPGGVLPLLTSLLAPPGLPLPPLDMPVPPPPAANAKPGIKITAIVAKDLSFIPFLQVLEMSREMGENAPLEEMFLDPGMRDRERGLERSAPYCAVSPPSTMNSAPVVNEDSSLARKRIVLATSSALPMRPIGAKEPMERAFLQAQGVPFVF